MTNPLASSSARSVIALFSVPWTGFVVAFLYYVAVTLVAVGFEQLPDLPMAVAYLLPPAAYALTVLAHVAGRLARLPAPLTPAAPVAVAH